MDMSRSATNTILSLDAQRRLLQEEKQQILLDQAEMEHELKVLRHMRAEIVGALLERKRNRDSDKGARHTIARVARIIRNTDTSARCA